MNNVLVESKGFFSKIANCKICHAFVLILFFFSFINSPMLAVFMLISPLLLIYQEGAIDGSIYTLLYIQTRSVLNKAIAIEFSGYTSILKWCVIFGLSFMLIYNQKERIPSIVCRLLGCYLFSLIFIAFVCSSYPVVSSFKIISYAVPFYALISGVLSSERKWCKVINGYFGLIMCLCVVTFVVGKGYYISEYGTTSFFCGAINHPNLLGSILNLGLACYLTEKEKLSFLGIMYIGIILFFVYMSKARAAFFYFFILLFLFVLMKKGKANLRVIRFIMLLLVVVVSVVLFKDLLLGVIHKYGNGDIMDSRESQLSGLIERIKYNPLLGTGFNVPFKEGFKSFAFTFDLPVENGNLILAIIADSGLIGFLLFFLVYYNIYKLGSGILLFITPMLVSMTEQVFFSTNNIGIYLYMFYAMYLANNSNVNKNNGMTTK